MTPSINVVALVKASERYIFLYDDGSVDVLLQQLGQFAANKELSLTWYDAAVLSQKVRRLKDETEAQARDVNDRRQR